MCDKQIDGGRNDGIVEGTKQVADGSGKVVTTKTLFVPVKTNSTNDVRQNVKRVPDIPESKVRMPF